MPKQQTSVDSADGVRVGEEPVPDDEAAVHLSRTYRNHRTHRLVPLRTIKRFSFQRQDYPCLKRKILNVRLAV